MSKELETYVERIVAHTDCNKADRDDLYEEMLIHLTILRDEHREQGKGLKEANQMAMKSFGKEADLGDQFQQAMFPYRKELLLLLALLGFIFTIGQFLYMMMAEQVVLLYSLTGIIGHSAVLFFALNKEFPVNRKLWLGLALLLNFLLLLWNGSLLSGNNGVLFVAYLLILILNVFLLYRTVLTYPTNTSNKKTRRVIHAVNITLGILTILPAAYIYAMAIGFGAPQTMFFYLLGPIIGWIILYSAQVLLARRYPKTSLGSLVLSLGMLSAILWLPFLLASLSFDA
ncbi:MULTISPECIES: hypothetical protein [Gracilibacillus]|uniref:hypothetical protein n=1 Tax=Gracilibacillus TaxID=74385 RepID=UPI000825F1F5|nr:MULTISPECIES: hypothetical protein [Gracilibacillus]